MRQLAVHSETELEMIKERLSYNFDEAVEVIGLNRNAVYSLMAKGELITFKVGRRRMISAKALQDFVEKKEREAAAAGVAA